MTEQPLYPRRSFIKAAAVAAAGAAFFPDLARAQSAQPWVRKDLATLSPTDPIIVTLTQAVSLFKSAPASAPYNWNTLASLHFNQCAHQNWFILPWHRAYIGYFEYQIQNVTGNKNFALPYWNWTKNPSIPAVFNAGPLYDSTRQVGPTAQISSNYVGLKVMKPILANPDFQSFGSASATNQRQAAAAGALEATPHNHVHNWIEGDMGTYWSPLDPLFWVHHANVDRLWACWNQTYANPTDPTWTNYTLIYGASDFPSLPVSPWTLSTQALGYVYDNQKTIT